MDDLATGIMQVCLCCYAGLGCCGDRGAGGDGRSFCWLRRTRNCFGTASGGVAGRWMALSTRPSFPGLFL